MLHWCGSRCLGCCTIVLFLGHNFLYTPANTCVLLDSLSGNLILVLMCHLLTVTSSVCHHASVCVSQSPTLAHPFNSHDDYLYCFFFVSIALCFFRLATCSLFCTLCRCVSFILCRVILAPFVTVNRSAVGWITKFYLQARHVFGHAGMLYMVVLRTVSCSHFR